MTSRPGSDDCSTAQLPVERRLSGDFGSPLELMASKDLASEHTRQILEVWRQDLKAQPDGAEKRQLGAAMADARTSVGG